MDNELYTTTRTFTQQDTLAVLVVAASLLYFFSTLYVISVWFMDSRLVMWLNLFEHQHLRYSVWRAARQFAVIVLTSLPFAGVILWVNRKRWLTISSALPLIALTVAIVPASSEAWARMPPRQLFFALIFVAEYLVTLPLVTSVLFSLTRVVSRK